MVNIVLHDFLIPLHHLDCHYFDLDEGQIFAYAASGSTTENHAWELLLFLVVRFLPPFGDKLKRVFEEFGFVEYAHPAIVNKSSLPDPNSSNQSILD